MDDDNFIPTFNPDEQFKLPKFADFSFMNEIKNRKANKEGIITAPLFNFHLEPMMPGAVSVVNIPADGPYPEYMRKVINRNETFMACYLAPTDDPTEDAEYILPIVLEMAPSHLVETSDDQYSLLVQARRRLTLIDIFVNEEMEPCARVKAIRQYNRKTEEMEAMKRSATKNLERYASLIENNPEELSEYASRIDDSGKLADFIASSMQLNTKQRVAIFTETNDQARLELINTMLEKEISLLQLESEIHKRVHQEMDQAQRDAYLREQIAQCQKELSDGKSADPDIRALEELYEKLTLPEEANKAAIKELERLKTMPPLSPESGMLSSYLHWLLELPWNQTTEDKLDVTNAYKILDRNHHGLKKAKDRILEYLAVRSLKPKRNRQPILCFVGPPGTGKTSLGRSIAEAMGRNFVRLSLGGVHDEAEIRGHRRTYIGSMPGRILQTLTKAGVSNPVFMMDEIDKLNADFQGDPAAALLEVLDPEQNNAFADHFLEVPYDLSQVLFITTANTVTTLPPALVDRMELIEFSGYIEEEKITIARQFLIPEQLLETGLDEVAINFSDEALSAIITGYTGEAGVRNLEREIGSVLRKLARLKSENKPFPLDISPEIIGELLGPNEFFPQNAEDQDEIGMATAMAWTENGGEIMPIEVLVIPGKGNLQITGQIGEIMQESAQAALSYLKSRAENFKIPEDYFEDLDMHIHVPEGAIPKDGPSAGITLATALTSAVLGVPVHHDLAMTGEITLRGRVLPVGGVREKVIAAHRSGIKTILLPEKNRKDLSEIPEQVRKEVKLIFVEHVDLVLQEALTAPPVYARPEKSLASKKRKADEKNKNKDD